MLLLLLLLDRFSKSRLNLLQEKVVSKATFTFVMAHGARHRTQIYGRAKMKAKALGFRMRQ